MSFKRVFLILVIVLCSLLVTTSNAVIIKHTVLPDNIVSTDVSGGLENPRTSGLNFSVNTEGRLVKVRLWVAEGRQGLHTVAVWDIDTGDKIAGPFEWSLDGFSNEWVEFSLASPIDIEANKSYGITVSDNHDAFMSAIHGYWDNHDPASDVFVSYHRGFSWNIDELPSNWNSDGTYMVDIVFETGEEEAEETATETETYNPATSDNIAIVLLALFLIGSSLLLNKKMKEQTQ